MSSVTEPLRLADGTVLARTMATTPQSLRVGDWVSLEAGPHEIHDLRFRADGGRVVHLIGHAPVSLQPHQTVLVYGL